MNATAVAFNGYTFAALTIIVVAILFVVVIAARLIRRDENVRTTRVGVFVERERFDDEPEMDPQATEVWPRHDPPLDG